MTKNEDAKKTPPVVTKKVILGLELAEARVLLACCRKGRRPIGGDVALVEGVRERLRELEARADAEGA